MTDTIYNIITLDFNVFIKKCLDFFSNESIYFNFQTQDHQPLFLDIIQIFISFFLDLQKQYNNFEIRNLSIENKDKYIHDIISIQNLFSSAIFNRIHIFLQRDTSFPFQELRNHLNSLMITIDHIYHTLQKFIIFWNQRYINQFYNSYHATILWNDNDIQFVLLSLNQIITSLYNIIDIYNSIQNYLSSFQK